MAPKLVYLFLEKESSEEVVGKLHADMIKCSNKVSTTWMPFNLIYKYLI